MHLLLRVPSFNRWPLAVRFLCDDVYTAWQKYSKENDSKLRDGFRVFCDFDDLAEPKVNPKLPASAVGEKKESPTMAILEKINVTYSGLKPHIAKSLALAAEKRIQHCSICQNLLDPETSMFLVCPSEQCSAAYHMACLARKWTENQQPPGFLLPVSGSCVQCSRKHQWIDLVKEMSIRQRGGKDLAKLMKEPRKRKCRVTEKSTSSKDASTNDRADRPLNDLQVILEDSLMDVDFLVTDANDDPLPEGWQELVDDDDNMSVTSTESGIPNRNASPVRSKRQGQKLEIVIEDSEWDSAEALD